MATTDLYITHWGQVAPKQICGLDAGKQTGAVPMGQIASTEEASLRFWATEYSWHRGLDRTAMLALGALERLIRSIPPPEVTTVLAAPTGILLGSSRGATGIWEERHAAHLAGQRLGPLSSPLSTAGNLSSWLAQHWGTRGGLATAPLDAFSVTCSSALAALVSGVAWLRAGFADAVLVGGAEAPLTPFTLAQMQALGIYSPLLATDMAPCRPFALAQTPTNTFVLAEGAAIFRLVRADQPPPLASARVVGWGWGNERIPSPTGISPSAHNLRMAMHAAWCMAGYAKLDVILAHAPGTRQGDAAELGAIQSLWEKVMQPPPPMYPIKWLMGHALGAAGALSLAAAIGLLAGDALRPLPYPAIEGVAQGGLAGACKRVMVNAAGFGGNAISVILERV